MAFIKSFEDTYGSVHAESYWYPGRVTIDKHNNAATLLFFGFKNKVAKEAGKQPIGERTVNVQGDVFNSYLSKMVSGEENALALAYQAALDTKDTPHATEINDDGSPKLVSFFADATNG